MIWDEVGEDQFEREKVLVDLEHECLQVYRRKINNANMSRARLHQELADSEAQFTCLLLSLDERSLPARFLAKNLLDTSNDSNTPLNSFVKPPANFVVLEGDCLDVSGESGELESYLVNNGNVELVKGGVAVEFDCYTAENPFHVRLLNNEKRAEVQLRSSNKRPKAQLKRGKENHGLATGSTSTSTSTSSPLITVKLGKTVGIRCTPDSKRRRRSRLINPDGLNSAG